MVRTHPDLQFFLDKEHGPSRYEALQRILFVYAKLNPGVRYVQGMNELVGTLYYVFSVESPGGVDTDSADGAGAGAGEGAGAEIGMLGGGSMSGGGGGGSSMNSGGSKVEGDAALFFGAENAEADAFVCFSNLMGELRDVFVEDLDNSASGIRAKMKAVNDLLLRHDPELHG